MVFMLNWVWLYKILGLRVSGFGQVCSYLKVYTEVS